MQWCPSVLRERVCAARRVVGISAGDAAFGQIGNAGPLTWTEALTKHGLLVLNRKQTPLGARLKETFEPTRVLKDATQPSPDACPPFCWCHIDVNPRAPVQLVVGRHENLQLHARSGHCAQLRHWQGIGH